MRQKVCAVFDSAMQAYLRPFFVPTTQMAVRSFTDEVNRRADDNNMFRHPGDYVLWYLCDFDEESGLFLGGLDAEQRPHILVRATDIQSKE